MSLFFNLYSVDSGLAEPTSTKEAGLTREYQELRLGIYLKLYIIIN